jgi:hypothetical protein
VLRFVELWWAFCTIGVKGCGLSQFFGQLKLPNPVKSFIVLCILPMGCTFTNVESAPPPTATTLRVIQSTPVPTVNRALQQVASQIPEPTSTATIMDCQATAGRPTTLHTVRAQIDYTAHAVVVEQRVRHINRGNEPLTEIMFSVEPNRIAGAFTMEAVEFSQGVPVPAYELTGRRLEVELSEALAPGCALELVMEYRLIVPPIGDGISGYSGYFGYTPRQFNLGHWLATLLPRNGGAWITHEVAAIGEQILSDTADWEITLNIANAPDNFLIAAPGDMRDLGDNTWRFAHMNAREFSLSMSDQFNFTQEETNGVRVELYSFDDALVQTENGTVDGAVQALDAAVESLTMFSDLFGDYPYERLVIVQGDFPDGMELSGLVFVSGDWFRSYTGSPAGYLTIITVHEVAHQWWYARVGSDQANTPWLDEALATYSELVYYEEHYPALREWWWQFRVETFVPADYAGATVDSSVYQFSSIREYINAVYLRGARMLDALRRDLGTDAFFDWLRRYANAGTDRIVTPDLFWSLLSPAELLLTEDTRALYLSDLIVTTEVPVSTEEGD